MIGKITSQSTVNQYSGLAVNYYQLSFELIDLTTSETVWGNLYDVKKAGADDRIYH